MSNQNFERNNKGGKNKGGKNKGRTFEMRRGQSLDEWKNGQEADESAAVAGRKEAFEARLKAVQKVKCYSLIQPGTALVPVLTPGINFGGAGRIGPLSRKRLVPIDNAQEQILQMEDQSVDAPSGFFPVSMFQRRSPTMQGNVLLDFQATSGEKSDDNPLGFKPGFGLFEFAVPVALIYLRFVQPIRLTGPQPDDLVRARIIKELLKAEATTCPGGRLVGDLELLRKQTVDKIIGTGEKGEKGDSRLNFVPAATWLPGLMQKDEAQPYRLPTGVYLQEAVVLLGCPGNPRDNTFQDNRDLEILVGLAAQGYRFKADHSLTPTAWRRFHDWSVEGQGGPLDLLVSWNGDGVVSLSDRNESLSPAAKKTVLQAKTSAAPQVAAIGARQQMLSEVRKADLSAMNDF